MEKLFRFVLGVLVLGILGLGFATIFSLSNVYGQQPVEDNRRIPFIVYSDDPALKRSLGVRHEFPGKFTSNLSLAEAHQLNQQGIQTERVLLYRLSPPPGACSPWPECKNGGGDDGGTTTRTATPSDQTPWGIEVVYADSNIDSTSGGSGTYVAVLDTGVYKDHLDLKNRVKGCANFTGGGPPGSVSIKDGECEDKNGHGTHVAGTILADAGSDGLGIYGVAPQAWLLAYKVCGNNGCWTDDIAAAIDYAGSDGAHIVSMSLGGDSESTLIKEAINRNLHILFVAAAGNDGPSDGSIDYPGANPNVIAAGAIDKNINVPSWSSRGINDGDYVIEAREVEFGTPGVSVESTWNDGAYNVISGTSMATPHVSGLAAKLWQGSPANTRSHLQSLARDIGTAGDDTATGFGLPQVP